MAIKREEITSDFIERDAATHAPTLNAETVMLEKKSKSLTSNRTVVAKDYENDASADGSMLSGARLPKDMTVSLVRADAANWETFISVLHSLVLSVFMFFLAEFLPVQDGKSSFSFLENVALWFLGGLTIILWIVWLILKINQQKSGVIIPIESLKLYNEKQRNRDK